MNPQFLAYSLFVARWAWCRADGLRRLRRLIPVFTYLFSCIRIGKRYLKNCLNDANDASKKLHVKGAKFYGLGAEMEKRTVAVNERGYRVGEDHQAAVLTDAEVDLIRELRETGGWTYAALAEKFEVGKSTIQDICTYRRRGQRPASWKEVRVSTEGAK